MTSVNNQATVRNDERKGYSAAGKDFFKPASHTTSGPSIHLSVRGVKPAERERQKEMATAIHTVPTDTDRSAHGLASGGHTSSAAVAARTSLLDGGTSTLFSLFRRDSSDPNAALTRIRGGRAPGIALL